ncbi:hypothetical protein PV08_01947 [Exophiala spinifera]|uniref:Uncharacterized protein n=1 Tax=Exophiala spinifera TaxID=91928 RepID=A0A0D2A9B1_9EURO|nr:uncharacterized protein PV08_01947 [Exophiala spinifera]KIW21367.1 hypothetical protein PV08_01947 [Exophiala spinifera]
MPRVVAIHVDPDGTLGPANEYQDSTALQTLLCQRTHTQTQSAAALRTIYILEALSPDFVAVLGSHFQLHPTLFADHDRLVALENRATGELGGIPFLPSAIHGRDFVSLKYHEPLRLSSPPPGFRNVCDVSGRHIAVTRIAGSFSDVVIARRKCTFWTRKTEGGGWDWLIVCDPPIKRILTNYSGQTGYNVTTVPYKGGYRDFMPLRNQIKNLSAPPRTSLLDDLIFYLYTYSDTLNPGDPLSLRVFIEKIIASHYLKLSELILTLIERIQFDFSRKRDLSSFVISAVEEQWSDVQALQRRIGEYQDDLEATMLQLRISFDHPDVDRDSDWKYSAVDYQFLYLRFKEIGQRANSLNGSTAALASLTNSRQAAAAQTLALEAAERSIREAKSVKALSILGVIFIPLAYVASLFSMSQPYNPGGEQFWVYFVVAFPMIGVVLLCYYTLELGYAAGGMRWPYRSVMAIVKQRLKQQ